MATAYVIHADEDTQAVKQRVLPALPSNGYDRWLGSRHVAGAGLQKEAIGQAMEECQVILGVLSPAILASPTCMAEIELALACPRMVIVVQIAPLSEQDATRLPAKLWAMPNVDLPLEGEEEGERLLVGLLPPVEGEPDAVAPEHAERIEWNEEIFSAALARATTWHDHARAEALVEAIAGHLAHRPYPYPLKHAANDLKKLRQDRAFRLMIRYAEQVIASGTRGDAILSQYGQALIEIGEYDPALQVLQSIIDDPESSQGEKFEARGLMGRTFKQRYVNAPDAPGAAGLLLRAIEAYHAAYVENPANFWHGVNAASCMLRAERDGIEVPPGRAREIAGQIAEALDPRKEALEVWDCASRVEALLALGEYDEAERALDAYINHPDMRAFEVSSTFRQYDQVLQLDRDERGAAILARLRGAMERYRAGTVAAHPAAEPSLAMEAMGDAVAAKPLVIRVGDSAWQPRDVPDLVIQSRLGKIVTARGSDASVRELLTDTMVIAVEESRPGGKSECVRSMPFIKVAPQYSSAAGPYVEAGDRALIAVIDNGIDVLHQAFLDAAGKSRIVGIWDQTDGSGPPPEGFSYGTFHDEAAVAGYVKDQAVPAGLGRNQNGHGTHVASIAGGRAAGPFAGGLAQDAKLLIIKSASSGPIGYSQSHVDALVFIDAQATRLGLPVVVNVSQGMNAGAHDGKSALEVAFDEFSGSGRKQGRVVVKSAGNERGKDGHAKVTMSSDALDQLSWRRDPGAGPTDRIELWWSSADEIEFRLRDPFKEWSDWVGTAAPERKGRFSKGTPFSLVFTRLHVDNGDSQLLIELGDATAAAAPGDWLLEMRSAAIREGGEVHAWIERGAGVPTSFRSHVDEEMTLSIPGTAQSVIAVGAVDASRPIQVGSFSSYGPTRDGQKKPLVCAPGVNVQAACGGTGQGVLSQNGTSMAAPHVAGAIALLLSRTEKKGKVPSGNQIAAALRQKTQNYNGTWNRGQGYGVIDVSALLAAFD